LNEREDSLFIMPEGVESRWASPENPSGAKGKAAMSIGARKGRACLGISAGEQVVLAEEAIASGTIRRIWITCNNRTPEMLRGLKLDFYWDGAAKPAVNAPLGDFFGTGLGRTIAFHSALFSNPEGRSFNCNVPMPFKKGMRIVITNESDMDLGAFYYDINYTIGDIHKDDALYFHAHYRRENPTKLRQDYEILPKVTGKGRFIGSNIGVAANQELYFKAWWGEGECKIYLDGDTDFPTLSGTGTEDYIGTGWGQGQYDNLYQGCHIADLDNMQYCLYRYHLPDPVYFYNDIRVTIQQMGCWAPNLKPLFHNSGIEFLSASADPQPIDFSENSGIADYGLFEREDDWSSCAYFYLDSPVNGLPPIDAYDKRIPN
jgi:hypothetical protein